MKKLEISNFSDHPRRHARGGDDAALLALAAELRQARIGAGLTQNQLSLAAGISRDTIIALESGRAGVALGKAMRLLRALGMTLQLVPRR